MAGESGPLLFDPLAIAAIPTVVPPTTTAPPATVAADRVPSVVVVNAVKAPKFISVKVIPGVIDATVQLPGATPSNAATPSTEVVEMTSLVRALVSVISAPCAGAPDESVSENSILAVSSTSVLARSTPDESVMTSVPDSAKPV